MYQEFNYLYDAIQSIQSNLNQKRKISEMRRKYPPISIKKKNETQRNKNINRLTFFFFQHP